MKWSSQTRLELEPNEMDLLVWNISNEVINGFKVDNFEKRIGLSSEQFKSLSNRLRSISKKENVVLDNDEAGAFRNALALTLEELGLEEFFTRTGYEFEQGKILLQEFDRFLGRAM